MRAGLGLGQPEGDASGGVRLEDLQRGVHDVGLDAAAPDRADEGARRRGRAAASSPCRACCPASRSPWPGRPARRRPACGRSLRRCRAWGAVPAGGVGSYHLGPRESAYAPTGPPRRRMVGRHDTSRAYPPWSPASPCAPCSSSPSWRGLASSPAVARAGGEREAAAQPHRPGRGAVPGGHRLHPHAPRSSGGTGTASSCRPSRARGSARARSSIPRAT